MAAQEEVDELREEVARQRSQFETMTAAEQGRRAQLDKDLRAELQQVRDALETLPDMEEFYAHIGAVQEKFEEDHGAVHLELALLRVAARESATASAVTVFSPQAFAASAAAGQKLHLTQRKGFEGLATYGGGAQWQDWAVHYRGLAPPGKRGLRGSPQDD